MYGTDRNNNVGFEVFFAALCSLEIFPQQFKPQLYSPPPREYCLLLFHYFSVPLLLVN